MKNCPGQDRRELKIIYKLCSNCGYEVEIFSDEIKIKCPKCYEIVKKHMTPSCLQWCKQPCKEVKDG